ncbi:MAG: hypothetical protein ACXVAK_18000 [Vulcanimicrobiaceae bacterium]
MATISRERETVREKFNSAPWFKKLRSVLPLLKGHAGALSVFICLATHAKADDSWAMYRDEIAAETGLHWRNVSAAIKWLQDRKLISVRRLYKLAPIYTLNYPSILW